MRKITLKQIAEESGVSVMTACYVLNNRGHLFRQKTRDAVTEAATRLGYKPNSAAKAVLSGRFNCISLLFAEGAVCKEFPRQLLCGIQDELEKSDQHLVLSRIREALAEEEGAKTHTVPKVLRLAMADGLLINAPQALPEAIERELALPQPPMVWINREREHDAVYPDIRGTVQNAVCRLLQLGHRKIAFLHPEIMRNQKTSHCLMQPRSEAYLTAMAEAGLAPLEISIPGAPATWIDWVQNMLQSPERPTAILTVCGDLADIVIPAAFRAGLAVPAGLSVMALLAPPRLAGGLELTAMNDESYEVGRCAALMLMKKIERPQEPFSAKSIPCAFIAGATIGPVPKS